jgi:NAD(P)-dependent dehydrogenase (short-subunit alcohol dehydrogenase family)
MLPEAAEADRVSGPLDLDIFRETFATNLFGVVATTEAFLPLLRHAPAGRVVNVSSTVASLTDQSDPDSPYYGLVVPAYQASKAALNSVTIALSKALAETHIKVNAVCPGWVQTDLGGPTTRLPPRRRLTRPRASSARRRWSATTARRWLLRPGGPSALVGRTVASSPSSPARSSRQSFGLLDLERLRS